VQGAAPIFYTEDGETNPATEQPVKEYYPMYVLVASDKQATKFAAFGPFDNVEQGRAFSANKERSKDGWGDLTVRHIVELQKWDRKPS
jgi:hypothetical protein